MSAHPLLYKYCPSKSGRVKLNSGCGSGGNDRRFADARAYGIAVNMPILFDVDDDGDTERVAWAVSVSVGVNLNGNVFAESARGRGIGCGCPVACQTGLRRKTG